MRLLTPEEKALKTFNEEKTLRGFDELTTVTLTPGENREAA
jgi:hypothetical protein